MDKPTTSATKFLPADSFSLASLDQLTASILNLLASCHFNKTEVMLTRDHVNRELQSSTDLFLDKRLGNQVEIEREAAADSLNGHYGSQEPLFQNARGNQWE
ncbi:hypothetical protein JHK85_025964 [Glycine max]|nr:hypothetical protein JHK85_025964 [Glycine max]KAG5013194.1 hypothetical protein JHK86_025455 [Glycine max]